MSDRINQANLQSLYRILSNTIKCTIDGIVYIYNHPSIDILYEAEVIYNDFMLSNMELITSEELILQLIQDKMWTTEKETFFYNFNSNLDNLKLSLYEAYQGYRNRDSIKNQIQKLRLEYEQISFDRHRYTYICRDKVANDYRMDYILDKTVVPKIDVTNSDLLNQILVEIFSKSVPDNLIRNISKMIEWKAMWNAADGNMFHLFGKPSVHLSGPQIGLINWSKFYDRINEHTECPPKEVLDDDDMLDGWVILQNRKRSKEKGDNTNYAPGSEVFVMVENPDDVKRIESKNDFMSRIIKKQRENVIKRDGVVEEQHLPDAKQRISEQARAEQIRRMHGGKKS